MAWKKRGPDADGGVFPGGTWHIFPHVIETTLVDGSVRERSTWRGVVHTKADGRLRWKADKNRHIVELWVRDKVEESRIPVLKPGKRD